MQKIWSISFAISFQENECKGATIEISDTGGIEISKKTQSKLRKQQTIEKTYTKISEKQKMGYFPWEVYEVFRMKKCFFWLLNHLFQKKCY